MNAILPKIYCLILKPESIVSKAYLNKYGPSDINRLVDLYVKTLISGEDRFSEFEAMVDNKDRQEMYVELADSWVREPFFQMQAKSIPSTAEDEYWKEEEVEREWRQ